MSDSAIASPWYADGLSFTCTQCGNCCSGAPGYVWVTVDELDRIARFLDLPTAEFDRHHVRRVGRRRSLRELPGGDCEFLERRPDGKTSCRIHPVRPIQCRTWPFWPSNVRSPSSWKATAAACPGVSPRAERHPLPVIQATLDANGSLPL